MTENHMVVDELYEMPTKKCRRCKKPTSHCECEYEREDKE